MKKQLKNWQKFVLPILATTTTLSSGAFILSSCVNKDKNTLSDKNIVLHDESPKENVIDTNTNLTLFVNVSSTKSLNYQWYVNKGKTSKTTLFTSSSNADQWEKIENATSSSYSISSEDTQNVTTDTTWKYKVEISYEDDDASIKTTSNFYDVKIKANSGSTPDDSNPDQTPSEPNNPDTSPPTNGPDVLPEPDTKPEEKPEIPPSNGTSSSINSKSIKLKKQGQMLPSQYLIDLNGSELNASNIETKFDSTKIIDVSYTVDSLDDSKGTLTLTMNYTENNNKLSHVFNFNNLLKLDNSGYNIEFENSSSVVDISAQDIASKNIDDDNKFKLFIQELNENNVNFKFKNRGNELPLNYLNTNGLTISGFSSSWFTSNAKMNLNFTLKNPKINYYVKEKNENLKQNSFDYPSNLNKQTTIQFYSACDYLLSKITSNKSYSSNKYADYYYYDIKLNNSINAQTEIADGKWLSNVTNRLTFGDKSYVYKPGLEQEVDIYDGVLDISLRMELVSSDSKTKSQLSKNITVSGFEKYDENNLFTNEADNKGKFSISCNPDKYDSNINILKRQKDYILSEIKKNKNSEIVFDSIITELVMKPIVANLSCKFSGEELIKENNFYKNEHIAINMYYIDYFDATLKYDATNDLFKIVINDFSFYSQGFEGGAIYYTETVEIGITHPKASLEKLEKNNK